MEQVEIALRYAAHGIKVFPCDPVNKSPLKGTKGFHSATTDESVIKKWWSKHPHSLVAAPNEDFLVLDIDLYRMDAESTKVVEGVKDRLCKEGLISIDCPTVRTKSGGIHVYFRNDANYTRRIKFLPQIDLLGEGGYCILPDQTTYVCETHAEPWDTMFADWDALPVYDGDAFESIVNEYREVTLELGKAVKAFRNGGKAPASKSSSNKTTGSSSKAKTEKKSNGDRPEDFDPTNTDANDGKLYEKTLKEYDKYDPEDDIIGEDGFLTLDYSKLTSEMIGRIFHNRKVQLRFGALFDLKIPQSAHDKTSNRSVFVGHTDENPSMGVRWDKHGTHLLIRDFANHYSDFNQQNDYNLVRAYCTIKYKRNVLRLNNPEFVVWFSRMLFEAGLIDLSPYFKEYGLGIDEVFSSRSKSQRKVAEDILLLDALKSMYHKYDHEFVFADNFAAAWTGTSTANANKAKRKMIEMGMIEVVGECNCGKNTQSKHFVTPIYRIVTKADLEEDTETETNEEKEGTVMQENTDEIALVSEDIDTIEEFDRFDDEQVTTVVSVSVGEWLHNDVLRALVSCDFASHALNPDPRITLFEEDGHCYVRTPELLKKDFFFGPAPSQEPFLVTIEPMDTMEDTYKLVVSFESAELDAARNEILAMAGYEKDDEAMIYSFVAAAGFGINEGPITEPRQMKCLTTTLNELPSASMTEELKMQVRIIDNFLYDRLHDGYDLREFEFDSV